jgi:hypothetical protein
MRMPGFTAEVKLPTRILAREFHPDACACYCGVIDTPEGSFIGCFCECYYLRDNIPTQIA